VWASAMVENWWHFGLAIPGLDIKPGQPKKNCNKSYNTLPLAELGINRMQAMRCKKLAEFSKAELDQYLEDKYLQVFLDHWIVMLQCYPFYEAK